MSITDNVRAILLAKGYRPYTLAADLGVSWNVAKRLLHGKTPFTFSDLALLNNRLGVSMNFLFDTPGAIAEREKRKAEQQEAERRERERQRLASWKPYSFPHTLGGHKLLTVDRVERDAAREQYDQYVADNEGRLTKDDIEAEALRIAQQFMEATP